MKKTAITTALCLSAGMGLTTQANADTLGFKVGAYSWQQEFTGDIQSGTGPFSLVDIENDLGYDDEGNTSFYVAFEHPIPLIPNVMLARTDMEISATSTATFIFDGVPFSGSINSTTDLSHTDATIYYEILDNWVSLDIGLTVRSFDEGFSISGEVFGGGTDSAELKVDEVIPMIYVGAKFELPLSGLYAIANGNWIGYDDNTLLDYKVGLGYETSIGLGIEAGLRSFEIEYEEKDDNEFADLTIDGIYAGVFYHF